MPTYGYICDHCEHEFEVFQSIKASALRKCPECGKLKLNRKIGTGGAVLFKGGGFWQTDYRSDSYKKGAEKDKPASDTPKSDSGGTKSESKADAKPAKTEKVEKAPKSKPTGKKTDG